MNKPLKIRATDRNGLEVLSPDECWGLMAGTPIGRVVFLHDGDAVVLPVNFAVVDHHLVFRSSRGAKFGAATMASIVSFEVDHFDSATRSGWSVLVKGRASIVVDADEEERLGELGLESWASRTDSSMWIRIQSGLSSHRLHKATEAYGF
jgi:nitroimidazol reductase NimA-like FMN-containing flavoprotein (pyridoxamine 5'-phosphate oxidase superfamily)